MTTVIEETANRPSIDSGLFTIPTDVLCSQEPSIITAFVKGRIPAFDAHANEACSALAARDAEYDSRVKEERSTIDSGQLRLAEAHREHGELRRQHGERIVAGDDCREIEKRLRQLPDLESRLQDELPIREAQLTQLEREAAPVHLEFIRERRNVFAEVLRSLKDEAYTARQRWGILLALSEAAQRRLDQYDEGLRIAQQRCSERCASREG